MAKLNNTINTPGSAEGPGRLLKRRLQSGDVLVGGMVAEHLRPSLVKLYVQAGFDFMYIEYEHGFFEMTTFADSVLCARDNNLPVIAKTPQLERAEVAKLLSVGWSEFSCLAPRRGQRSKRFAATSSFHRSARGRSRPDMAIAATFNPPT